MFVVWRVFCVEVSCLISVVVCVFVIVECMFVIVFVVSCLMLVSLIFVCFGLEFMSCCVSCVLSLIIVREWLMRLCMLCVMVLWFLFVVSFRLSCFVFVEWRIS